MDDVRLREVLETIIRASQGNFDHLSGEAKEFARRFNQLAGDVKDLYELLGIEKEQDSNEQSGAETLAGPNLDMQEHTHVDGDEGGQTDHGTAHTSASLGDDDHQLYLKEKASGGVAGEVPTHTHADAGNAGTVDHGVLTSLTGDHDAEYINEGQAAGGSLGGTYPDPTVDDDSHSHGTGTAPGFEIAVQEEDVTIVAALRTLDFAGAGFNVTDDGSGEVRIEAVAAAGGGGTKVYAHWLGG